jgi:broad specificity phosphatase PhoE
MEKHIYFVRHGESEGNVTRIYRGKETPLTDIGRAQAMVVAERVATLDIDVLISSDFLRAKDTAAIIGERLGVSPEEQPLFGEWLEPEHLLGKTYDHPDAQAMREALHGSDDPEFRHSTEENFAEMKARAVTCFKFLEQHPASRICVVSHLGFLRVLAGVALLDASFGKAQYSSLFRHLEGGNTGITYVRFDDENERWKLVTWNDISHFG